MSRTDKQAPGKVKTARGEKSVSKRYPDQVAWWCGRDPAWQEAVKAESGRARARLRRDARIAKDDPDHDICPPLTTGTDWVIY